MLTILIAIAAIDVIAVIAVIIINHLVQRAVALAESRASEAMRLASLAILRVSSSSSTRLRDSLSARTCPANTVFSGAAKAP